MNTLKGFMRNVKGPSKSKRSLFGGVIQSVLLYGAPNWVSSLVNNARNTTILARFLRQVTIRCMATYRTVLYDAVILVTRIPPINLFVKERLNALFVRRGGHGSRRRSERLWSALRPIEKKTLITERWLQRLEIMTQSVGSSLG